MRGIKEKVRKSMVLVAPGGGYTVKHSREVERELAIHYFRTSEEAVKALKLATEWYERYKSVEGERK